MYGDFRDILHVTTRHLLIYYTISQSMVHGAWTSELPVSAVLKYKYVGLTKTTDFLGSSFLTSNPDDSLKSQQSLKTTDLLSPLYQALCWATGR